MKRSLAPSMLAALALAVAAATLAPAPAAAIPICGDGICQTTAFPPESCSTCEQDCGICPGSCTPDFQKVSGTEKVCHIRSVDGSAVWRDWEALYTDVNNCSGSTDEYRLWKTDVGVCLGLSEWQCCLLKFGSSDCSNYFHNNTCRF